MAQTERRLFIEGLSKLQCREIYDAVDEGSVQLESQTEPTSLQVIGETALVILIIGYPIAKAIARAIARDRTTIRVSRELPDGTIEVLSIESTSAATAEGEGELEKRILKALEG